jgi:hypothetical protein
MMPGVAAGGTVAAIGNRDILRAVHRRTYVLDRPRGQMTATSNEHLDEWKIENTAARRAQIQRDGFFHVPRSVRSTVHAREQSVQLMQFGMQTEHTYAGGAYVLHVHALWFHPREQIVCLQGRLHWRAFFSELCYASWPRGYRLSSIGKCHGVNRSE